MNIRKAIDSDGSEYEIVRTQPKAELTDNSPAGKARAAGKVGQERVPDQPWHITPQGEFVQRGDYYKQRAARFRTKVTPAKRKRQAAAARKKALEAYARRIQDKSRRRAQRVLDKKPVSKPKHLVYQDVRGKFVLEKQPGAKNTKPYAAYNRPPKRKTTPSGTPAPASQMRTPPVAQPNPSPKKKFSWGDALKNFRDSKPVRSFDGWLQDRSGEYRPKPPKPLDQAELDLLKPKQQDAARAAFRQKQAQYLKDEAKYNTQGAAAHRRMKALKVADKKLKAATKFGAAQYMASPTTRRVANTAVVGTGAMITGKVRRARKRRAAEREVVQKPWKAISLKGGGKKLAAGSAVAALGAGAAYAGGKKIDAHRGY